MEQKQQQAQSHSQSLISCQRKIRSFRANFEKMVAVVQFNTVHIMTAGNFRIIDVLEGHILEILCMDVSLISKSIVSYSPGLLLVHAPIKSEGAFMSDHVISLGTLKWKEYWRQEMKISVRNLSISQIGDFFSLSGDGFLTVWVRDTPTDFTFSQFVYHSRDDNKGVIAQVIKQDEQLGSIIQQEATHDGRLIVCLEDHSKTVKIYYQNTLPQAKQAEEKDKEDDYYRSDNYGRGGRGYYGGGFGKPKEDRVEVQLEYNPYAADNEGAAANPFELQAQKTELKYQSDPISIYTLPQHKNTIEYFKMMHHDIFECEKRFLPNVLITVTSKNEIFIWQENMNSAEMEFICAHTLRTYLKSEFFDAVFLDFPPINPKRYVEMKTNVSRLFDSEHDKNLILKKEENTLSIFKPNYVETSIDWILVLNDQIIDIYKAEGLRNFPQKNIQVNLWNRYKLTYTPRDFYGSCKIVSASCRDFNDVISMYTLNSTGQLIKLRKDFKEQGQGKWRVDKVAILKRKYIEDVMTHTHLPIIAHLMNNTEIYFFIEEKTKNRLVKESLTGGSMRFLGAYSIYHQSQQKPLQIVRAKWVCSPLCMMIVQFTNDTMALVSSQSQLRMLSHGKYQEEYLKLWDSFETHGLSSQAIEKWEKIYEVHFNQGKQGHEVVDEHVIDFEVIKTEIEANAFTVNLVVFTSFNQYLVYETHTQLLPHLKSLSQTKLLYHVYTTDCPLQLLGSVHFKSEWAIFASINSTKSISGQTKTVLALMTEVDPQRQRQEKNKEDFVQKSNPYDFGMDDEKVDSIGDDSDDGDIFAQFSGGNKKKDKFGLLKKPEVKQTPAQEIQKVELKPTVIVKMLQFDEESSKNKSATELWQVELPVGFKNRMLKCRASEQFFAFLTLDNSNDDKEQLVVYLYDMLQNKYLGYINLHAVTGLKQLYPSQIDFIFSSASSKGSLTLYHKDTLYLIAESSREGLKGQWTLVKKFEKVLGLSKGLEIQHIRIQESFLRKQVLVVNKRILSVREKFTLKEKMVQKVFNEIQIEDEKQTVINEKMSLHNIYANAQKSFPIYHPKVLKRLFLKGYTTLVLKILVQLNKSLELSISQSNSNSSQLISEFLEFDLGEIVADVNIQIGSTNTTSSAKVNKKQETAAAMFGGWDDQDDDGDIFAVKKPALGKQKSNNSLEDAVDSTQLYSEFEELFPSLVKKIKTVGDCTLGLKEAKYRLMFIDFLKRFKLIFRKEFYSDILTQILLRDLFFDTEDIEQEEEEKLKANQDFNVKDFISQIKAQPSANSKANLANVKQWNSLQVCLALHSEAQDVLLNEINERFDFESNLTYDLFKRLSISIWLKDIYKIKNLVNIIAKNEYKTTSDDFNKESRAEKTALWYVLIDKKDQLARLYKQEPENKRVYELLLNDFTQQKWKTTAEKNAMVLVSKKRYFLAAAFFLLAGNIRDALFIAIDKMKDCVLGLLMSRLFEKEDIASYDQPKKEESKTDLLYREHFIERGKRLDDPYLQNIGYWQRKEYIQAVNVFHVEPQSVNSSRIGLFQMQQNIKEQDLFPVSEDGLDSDKDNLLLKQAAQAASTIKELIPVPIPTAYDYNSLDIVKQIKKSTMVKRALQQTTTGQKFGGGKFSNLGGGGGASIFDDFFGGDSNEEQNQQSQHKEEENTGNNKLIVEEPKILEFVTLRASQTGYSLQAIVIMAENIEHLPKQGSLSKQIIGLTLLSDFVNSPAFQYQSIKKLKASAKLIVDKLELNQDQVRSFILKQFKYNESFLMNVNYIAEDETLSEDQQKQEALQCVEEQALNMIDFVHSIADFPFSIVQDGKSHEFVNYTIKKAVGYLESLAESYIIVDMQIQHAAQIQTQKSLQKQVTQAKTSQPGLKNKISLTLADFQNEDGNYEFTVEEEKGNLDVKSIDTHKTKLQFAGINMDDLQQDTGARTRIAVVLYLGLFQVCMISRKFFLMKDLLQDIKAIFHSNIFDEKESAQIGLLMQKLKTAIQKLKYSLVPAKVEVDEDRFEDNFKENKPKTKEELEEELRRFKIDSFMNLWFHYVTSHWVQNQMRQAYQGGLLKGLIDIKPTLINYLPFNIAIEHILNPRISSTDLMKRFVNQDRILENVTTYYFENFLNLHERATISLDLQQLYANKYEIHNDIGNISALFGSEKRFAEYADFIELKSFIKHLRDHELSLVYHRNHDYSMRAVERTQQVYENGIDIFRMKTETVGDFAFDHCDLDLVAFALQSKGIREIPVKKSLIYRTRSQRGHQVVDEELGTWSECLHRFSKMEQDVRPSTEAVIGAVERLYQYKTINYAKKQRRSKGTFFLDYELNPPERWGDTTPQDFIHHRGEFDVTHEDYTNAIESHPYLPLYLSGDSRGLVCLWEFSQSDDHSLDQWVTDVEGVKIADVKKHLIKKIQFNGYGDKFYASNYEGLISVFNFDNMESPRSVPIFSLRKAKEEKCDFEILNQDTVFAVTSLKPKHTQIYDTLMPSRGGLVHEFAVGASVIKPFRSKSQMMLFNVDKPGNIVLFDLKMNKPVFQTNLHNEEVTSVAVTESETTLVAGFRDGHIKIFNMERDFETRESFQAFSSVGNKKGGVSQVRIHPTNGALFASSTIGNLKLFRTRV